MTRAEVRNFMEVMMFQSAKTLQTNQKWVEIARCAEGISPDESDQTGSKDATPLADSGRGCGALA